MTSIFKCLTAEQVKAARALLAWSQQDLARAARVAVSTVADFERGARTPVANNAQAIQEALEQNGLQFLAAGVVSKDLMPKAPAALKPGALLRWINATHLSQWGETRDGQSGMPELLRRLIYATVGPAADVRFPSDESVLYPGWDGICVTSVGGSYVPHGQSVWEIGAQRHRVRGKANEDFEKRTKEPLGQNPKECTFVFATPQRFVDKDGWVAEKKALDIWRDVVAINADDLVHWLETCPAVAQWLSVKIGRRPAGMRNLEETWSEWAGTTNPALTSDIVLTNRDDEQVQVLRWLRNPPALLSIQSEAPDEAIAFLYAAISPLPESYRLTYLSNCVVADTVETARDLRGLGTPLVIAMAEPDPGLAQQLVADGHHVFGAYGPNSTASNLLQLRRPWRFDLEQAIQATKMDEEEAHRLAHASGRSITVLRRLMPSAPQHRMPWATQPPTELIAAMFAGAWSDTNSRDRQILSGLSARPYEETTAALSSFAGLGGPIVRSGDLWKVVSLHDLWTQIGTHVTTDQFRRFEAAFQSVLSAVNPRYDQRPKSKYYEEPGEFGEECSRALRLGLTEAMVALAVYPERAGQIPHINDQVTEIIRNLLSRASPALWWSLSRDFQNLAEAAPEAFLDVLEDALQEDSPSIGSLFRSNDGFIHSSEYLSNLLWALEMLARSPKYLTRAALVLAHLDSIDPGGSWGNRPSASLRRIFVSWSPQSYATPEQRQRVVERIVRTFPKVGWKLLLGLSPKAHDVSEPSAKPAWRDFTPDQPEVVTWQSVAASASAIGASLLQQVGSDVGRWCQLIDCWANFGADWHKSAIADLEGFASSIADPATAETLRDKIRSFIQNHRGFSDADWAMPEEYLLQFDYILQILQPNNVEDAVRWLFRTGSYPLSPKIDWHEQERELRTSHIRAAETLLAERTTDQIFAFAKSIGMRHELGVALASTSITTEKKVDFIKQGFQEQDDASIAVAVGVLFGLKLQANGSLQLIEIWKRAIVESWGEAAEVQIAQQLPIGTVTWSTVSARSPSLEIAYWKTLPIYWLPEDADHEFVVGRLIAAGRAIDAVSWLGKVISQKPSGSLIINTLHEAAQSAVPSDSNSRVMFGYYVGLLLKYLDNYQSIDEKEIVSLEWIYFHALQNSDRPARTLHRALSQDPVFFVELLRLIYLPAKDSGIDEPTAHDKEKIQRLARQAYDVLHDWAHVPGANDDGTIDQTKLISWVKEARKLLNLSGRGEIGDVKIGEILSASKPEPDQPWPPLPVRETLETFFNRALQSGFETGVYNRRGVTVRMPQDGGEQERALAQKYRRDADALQFDWPHTAACLNRIARTYEIDATREDLSAEQRDWL